MWTAKTKRSENASTTGYFTAPASPGRLRKCGCGCPSCLRGPGLRIEWFQVDRSSTCCPTISDATSGMRRKSGALWAALAARLFALARRAQLRLPFHSSQHLRALAAFIANLGIGALQIDRR